VLCCDKAAALNAARHSVVTVENVAEDLVVAALVVVDTITITKTNFNIHKNEN
jgi:hypothetical protein